MNDEELLQTADAMRAFVDGNPVQYWDKIVKDWIEPEYPPLWDCLNTLYRPKPQPKRVHWSKPEHVPGPVCWLSLNDLEVKQPALIIHIDEDGVTIVRRAIESFTWKDIENFHFQYSIDRINWLPCEVEEQ